MISRYSRPTMAALWTEQAKFERWLEVELAHCRAACDAGAIPKSDLAEITSRAVVDVARINAIENTTNHDVIAFLESLAEKIGPAARHIHRGLTSTDIVDTALVLTLRRALKILGDDLRELASSLREKALGFRHLVTLGRTHGIHAEATTFGFKCAVWWDEARRNAERLARAEERVAFGKLSGAVGTYAETTPELESAALAHLGLAPAPIATQVLSRDIHAELLATLAIIAGSLEKIAVEVRHLQRTEVGEAAEPFAEGQKGSSAMPHKRNPIVCERITGLARVVRNLAGVAFEDQALWHERDISHSSAERIILADAFTLADYMLAKTTWVVRGLQVNADRIAKNLAGARGLIYSSRVLAELLKRGVTRETAYAWVQRAAMKVQDADDPNLDLLSSLRATPFPQGASPFTGDELAALFTGGELLSNVDMIFQRLGLK